MKKSKKFLIVFASVFSFIVLGFIGLYWFMNLIIYSTSPESYIDEYKDALPKTAKEISEKFIDAYPDWSYYLKAKVSESDFDSFVKELELEKNLEKKIAGIFSYDSTKYKGDDFNNNYIKQFTGMDWWNVKNKNSVYYAVYFHKNNMSKSGEAFATYEDEFLYFYVIKY